MALFQADSVRPDAYKKFESRQLPSWYRAAKLGIFVHWGPYSVPAWAEPTGEMGAADPDEWFAHNAYAEWYANTIRIDGSPAQAHHREVHGGAPYDDFLDLWHAEEFDPDELMALVASTGARYFIPTTKHHDGIPLWDAPGTGTRNTVHRGPKQDLIERFAVATKAAGLKFGVYYSGGLDWGVTDYPPIDNGPEEEGVPDRPVDAEYADYAYEHVRDLIDRYSPEILWDDIDWPDAGKEEGPRSLIALFEYFYDRIPTGVVNDRWGETHWDYRTSEYQEGRGLEGAEPWENTRGIGRSFGHNQLEDETNTLDGPSAIKHFVDVVSRGGNLLLNIGLTAAGAVPPLQRATLEALADWNGLNGVAVFDSSPLEPSIGTPSEQPWVRWTRTGDLAHAFIDAEGPVELDAAPNFSRCHRCIPRLANPLPRWSRGIGSSWTYPDLT